MSWTFLSNHAVVLLLLSKNKDIRMREIALKIGLTERAVQKIVHDLVEEGYIDITKDGRRNHYEGGSNTTLRCHVFEREIPVSELLELVKKESHEKESHEKESQKPE